MKIYSRIIPVFAAVLITAVFMMPFIVYANDELDDPTDVISYDDPIDINMEEPPSEPTISDNSIAFTPDGQASVVDLAYEGDGKMFYTFKTPAGNVFYLVVDRQRGGDNVYFLNAVTEQDLLALAEQPDKKTGSTSVIPATSEPPTEQQPPDGDDENPTETEVIPPKKNSNSGMIIFVVIGIAAVGGVVYYIKIVRPKQQMETDDEDDEEMEFEEEQPEETDDFDDCEDE